MDPEHAARFSATRAVIALVTSPHHVQGCFCCRLALSGTLSLLWYPVAKTNAQITDEPCPAGRADEFG